MITYVINTSESRTLNNNQLFELSGYNKIRWLNCPLAEVNKCAQHIYEKQNVLGAENFRIAILVDFFGFDKIRVPFGRINYLYDEGVDISLYLPFIEVYLMDNLIKYLENRDLYTSDFEIYYVQNTKLDQYEFIDNAKEQLYTILSGCKDGTEGSAEISEDTTPLTVTEEKDDNKNPKDKKDKKDKKNKKTDEDNEEEDEEQSEEEKEEAMYDPVPYTSFSLYCTKSMSLRFNLCDYPYGSDKMTFSQFYKAFNSRAGQKTGIRRHYYVSNFGIGRTHVEYDTLSLSLYLIRMYEREEMLFKDGDMEIAHIDPTTLKSVLETAWIKINLACELAKNNPTEYFSLADNVHVDTEGLKQNDNKAEAVYELYNADVKGIGTEKLYDMICYYHNRTPEQVASDNRVEFDKILSEYLKLRDDTREVDVEVELAEKIESGTLATTTKFPSKEDFENLICQKEDEISKRFEKALTAEYIEVDYREEKQTADKAYDKYMQLKACLHKNIIGDIIFMVAALLSFLIPYAVLQLTGYNLATIDIVMLMLHTLLLFGGIFILAVFIQAVTFGSRLSKVKAIMRGCYRECYIKDKKSMSQIRNRYKDDLIYIERTRYEIRQLKCLYEANLLKEANVKRHRDTLKMVNSQLSSILNSLDVKPILDSTESVSGEFDITKPIRSRENRIYRIFSLDTIEKLFSKGGNN